MKSSFEVPHSLYLPARVCASSGIPNWKPVVFSPFFLLFLLALHSLHIVGLQLLINARRTAQGEISRVMDNETVTSTNSIFIFEEEDLTSFLAWAYLPVSICLVVAGFWEVLDVTVRRLEPFRQLSTPEGGNVWNALCLDYTAVFGLRTPFKALKRRHFAVFLTSAAFVFVSIILPAMSGGLFSLEWGSLSFSAGKAKGPMFVVVSVNPGVAVATQAIHGTLCGVVVILTAILLCRRTGLYRDPKSIGGVATLISDSDRSGLATLRIFRQIPSFAHANVIYNSMRHLTFHLDHFPVVNVDGSVSTTYQLTVNALPGHVLPIDPAQRSFYSSRRDVMGFWLTRRMAWLAEILLWLGQASITTAIYYVAKILSYMEGGRVSRLVISKIMLTLCYTVGGMMWLSIQRNLQAFETWRRLCTGSSRSIYASLASDNAASLGLLGSAAVSITMGSFFTFWSSFCVFMVYAVTVFAPPILELAYASGATGNMAEYRRIGLISEQKGTVVASVVLSAHVVVLLNLFILTYNGRTRPFLPRAPTTLASQIVYLCRSDRLLYDFAGTSMLSKSDLARRLKTIDRRCLFGWFWSHQGQAWFVGVEEGEPSGWFDFHEGTCRYHPCT